MPSNTIEPAIVQTPEIINSFLELPRATSDTFVLLKHIRKLIRQAPKGNHSPILSLPGYGANDSSMLTLRFFLNRIGYNTFSSNLGRNFEAAEERIQSIDDACAFREKMVDLLAKRVTELYQQQEQKITLIGWSMGGCYALDLSQSHSEYIERVITLGTPFGDPRGTAMWEVMRRLNNSDVAVESMDFNRWLGKCSIDTTDIPLDIIYSEKDGIVSKSIAMLSEHPTVTHHQVDASHLSFTHNANVFEKIATLLAQQKPLAD